MTNNFKVIGALLIVVWIVGAMIMIVLYELDRRRQCVESEGWIKGLLWCQSDPTRAGMSTSTIEMFLNGLKWPALLLESISSDIHGKSDQNSTTENESLTQEYLENSSVATIYVCYVIAVRTDREADSSTISATVASIRKVDSLVDHHNDDFMHYAVNRVGEIEGDVGLEDYYDVTCVEPVERMRVVLRQGMLPAP